MHFNRNFKKKIIVTQGGQKSISEMYILYVIIEILLCYGVEGLDCNPVDVAVLFSNRAACYLKIGDCHSCVKDCTASIAMAPANSYKPLLRRALAYETMEKLVA